MDLVAWMADVVRQTGQPPEGGIHAETILMSTAQESIDVLMQAPPSMAVGSGDGKQNVHAEFRWGRFPDGGWYVSAVSFGLNLGAAQENLARQRALKQRLTDQAEFRAAQHVDLRQIAFPAEDHVNTWPADIVRGDRIIQSAIERAYEHASKDAKSLENPVTWKSFLLDLGGMGVGHAIGSLAEGAGSSVIRSNFAGGTRKLEKAAKELDGEAAGWYRLLTQHPVSVMALDAERAAGRKEVLEVADHARDLAMKDIELAKRAGEHEKSKGDKLLETAIDLAGFASPWVNTIAGMFFNIAIASDAARITRLRSRHYVWFVAGYVWQLTLSPEVGGPRKDAALERAGVASGYTHTAELWYRWDKKYFDLGVYAAPGPNSPGSFAAQVSLMHYAMEHYTAGGWGGLGFRSSNWTFPDEYIKRWSPALLGRALATQLHKTRYLAD